MKNKIKNLIKKQAFLLKIYRQFKHDSFLKPSVQKKIKGFGNKLNIYNSALLIGCQIDIDGNNNIIKIEGSTFFNNVKFYIRGNNNLIDISKNVQFFRGGSLWIEDEYCKIEIGEQTTFEDTHIAVTEPESKIIIGNKCMFAYDIDLRTGDSHSIIDLTTNKRINYAKNIYIEDHVWVAAHVSILKGVHILKDSVVATRSVVTNSFDKVGILIGGVPAKIIKESITWKQERIYE